MRDLPYYSNWSIAQPPSVELAAELAEIAPGDLNRVFLGQDGKIPLAIMPDQLHPNAAGYQLWADAMQPTLTALMK